MTGSSFKSVKHWLQRAAYDHAAAEMAQLEPGLQDSVEGLHLWAFISQKRSEWERLEKFGRELQRRAPDDSGGWFCVAESLYRRGRPKEAIDVLKTAEPLFKKRAEFLYALSRLHTGAGEYETAVKLLDEASALAPDVKEQALFDDDFRSIWLKLIDQQ